MNRDKRWEDVTGYIGPVRTHQFDDQSWKDSVKNFREISIVVRYNGTEYYSRHRIHYLDLEDLQMNPLPFLLGKMIAYIDEFLDGKRTNDE